MTLHSWSWEWESIFDWLEENLKSASLKDPMIEVELVFDQSTSSEGRHRSWTIDPLPTIDGNSKWTDWSQRQRVLQRKEAAEHCNLETLPQRESKGCYCWDIDKKRNHNEGIRMEKRKESDWVESGKRVFWSSASVNWDKLTVHWIEIEVEKNKSIHIGWQE